MKPTATATTQTVAVVTHTFPVLSLLGVAFVILKLCGVIGWSWWLVTLPFWGGLAVFVAILAAIALVTGLVLGAIWLAAKCSK